MKKDFNESVNEFVKWFVQNHVEDSISEEEFNVRLEKRKEEMVDNMEYFMEKFKDTQGFSNNTGDNKNSPIALFFLLMMFSKFGDSQGLIEDAVGRKLSKEETDEYVELITNKSNIYNIVRFLEDTKDIKDNTLIISPIVKSLFELKEKLLPYFHKLYDEVQNKLDDITKADTNN